MSMFRTQARVIALAAALVLLAQGSVASAPTETPVNAAEEHCVVDVIGEKTSGELIVSGPRCYRSFSEAVADATNGSVRIPVGTRGDVLFTDKGVADAFSSFTLGTHFDANNGFGSSITVVGSSCSGGYWNTGLAWRNRISSSYNGCGRLRHYDYANKGGASENTYGTGTTDNLGSLNNRTESVSYHSS